jgi:hypothetical protein
VKGVRNYLVVVLTLVGITTLGLLATWFWIEPLTGDATRLGWFAERDYGWTAPQEVFPRSQVSLGPYDRYYDVVVLGDSFSKHLHQREAEPTNRWPHYLSEMTGLSIVVLHLEETTIERLLENPVFKAHPPRILIYERVERYLDAFVPALSGSSSCDAPARTYPPLAFAPRQVPKRYERRETMSFDVNLGYVRGYLVRAMLRHVFGWQSSAVRRVALRRSDLFSSGEPDSLLVYKDEFSKPERAQGVEAAYCRIVNLQNLVEANGTTRLMPMIVPDKLTVYARHLEDPSYASQSWVGPFLDGHALPAPRIDRALIDAVARGERDVYLPDDTHWGATGHRIAAETIAQFLGDAQPTVSCKGTTCGTGTGASLW